MGPASLTKALLSEEASVTLQPHPHRPAVRTASGNGEERAAQIDRIQGRLDRLRRFAAEITTEVVDMTRDIENLGAHEPPTRTPPSAKQSN